MENQVRKYAALQLAEMHHKADPENKQFAEAFETAKAEYEKTQGEAEPKAEEKAEVKAEAEPKADAGKKK